MDMKAAVYQKPEGSIWKGITCFFIKNEDYSKFRCEFTHAKFIGVDDAFEKWCLDGFIFFVHTK